jgi:hypothetical protein
MFVKLYNKEKLNKNKTKQRKKTKKKDIFLIKQQVYKSFPMIPNFIVSINLLISASDPVLFMLIIKFCACFFFLLTK